MSKSRQFERLVASLEGALVPKGAIVKHPDYIADVDTGERREIDVSIRYAIGSVPILITVECRDRVRKDDVMWIEQLAQKQRSIRAAKTIAVSASGFSEPARRKAQLKGIELRTIRKIKPKDMESWIQDVSVSVQRHKTVIVGTTVGILGEKEDTDANLDVTEPGWKDRAPFGLPMFRRDNGTARCSLKDLFWAQIDVELRKKAEAKDFGVQSEHKFEQVFEPDELVIQTNRGLRSVSNIAVATLLTVDATTLIPSNAYAYTDTGHDILQRHDFVSELGGQELKVELILKRS